MSLKEAQPTWEKLRKLTDKNEILKIDILKEFRRLATQLESDYDEDVAGIEDFFKTVGEGVVKAQQSLDVRTLEYLSTRPAIPTAFRIPKAKAEIHFSATQQ